MSVWGRRNHKFGDECNFSHTDSTYHGTNQITTDLMTRLGLSLLAMSLYHRSPYRHLTASCRARTSTVTILTDVWSSDWLDHH